MKTDVCGVVYGHDCDVHNDMFMTVVMTMVSRMALITCASVVFMTTVMTVMSVMF
jgi:hypothetical protein